MTSNNNRSRDTTGPLSSKKKECFTFEPQQWRRTVCKNCFRSLPDHPTEPANISGNNGKGLSPRTSPLLGTKSVGSINSQSISISGISKDAVIRKTETSPTSRRRPKSDEFKQKTPSPRESKRTMGSNTGRKSPANSPSSSLTRHSGSFSANRQNSTSSIDTKYVEELENDFFDLEDKYDEMLKEKGELEKELSEKNQLNEDLLEDVEMYKNKILHFERRVQYLDEEVRSYRERLKLPESDQATIDVNDSMNCKHQELFLENEQLRVRMEEIEQLCQDVMEENDMLKEEQEEMQREIEEMHDHFQEDDTDTLRELKRDLETSNKNCRIFQFKLRKTERRYEQCENERSVLEEKLHRLETQLYSENDVNLIRGLEEELRVAKEVSVRLNSELELVDEKRSYFEEDNKHLKEELKDSETRRRNLETELAKCRQEIEKLKALESTSGLQLPDPTSKRKNRDLESLSREPSFEEQSLQRELDAAKERETDLIEQLKFAEDDLRKLKRRFNDIEEENDSLSKKLEAIMKSKQSIEDNECEDNASIQALKIQIELLEQQNSALRKSFVSIEKENINLFNNVRQLKAKSNSDVEKSDDGFKDEKYKLLETKITDLHSNVERLEKENRRLTLLNSLQQNPSAVKSKSQISYPVEATIDFIQNVQIQDLKAECNRLKEQIKQYDKQIKSILIQLEQQLGSQIANKKQLDYLAKYNESISNCKSQEKQILQLGKQIDNLKEENLKYKDFYDKNFKVDVKFGRSDAKSDLESASKSVLLEEIICLEDEIDELASKCEKADSKIGDLTKSVSEKDHIIEEMISDNERNDKELNQYIEHLLTKNALLSDLLSCVETRANELQHQFDRMASPDESADSSNRSSATTTTTNTTATENGSGIVRIQSQSKISAFSAGSDDVFSEYCGYQIEAPGNLNDAEKIKFRFNCLERLLSEERKRTRIAEKQVEMALKDSAHSRVNEDSQLKKKEIEMLKADLEEKNEMLEEKEQNILDLKNRLDQTRKMNEALRTLLDNQDESPSISQKGKEIHSSKEQSIEINSYKKEISALKSDLHQYAIKINESEKIREKLTKEIRNLQADMKVREEQIYEQDDEMRAKNHELKTVKRLLDETQNNLKNNSQTNNTSKEIEEKIRQIKDLENEIDILKRNLQKSKSQLEEQEKELKQNEGQQKILSDTISTNEERMKEKDDLIALLNQRLQNREKELNDNDLLIIQANDKLQTNQEIIRSTQLLLSQKEVDNELLKSKNDELQNSNDNITKNLQSVKKDNEKLKIRIGELEKEKSKPPLVPRISTTSPVDVDKLKLEISQLKKDKENLTSILNKDKVTFSATRRDSDTAKNESDSYMRAIQQQQYVTRVNLLTDNVTRLNRINIELKLQNESIQNNVLEYQRKYKNIKEQYEAEQEAWIAERITLSSRMKEYEDRKSVIVSLRKSLQDASLKVVDLETQLNKEKKEGEQKLEEQKQMKNELQRKLSTYEDQQKLPKVLQRFGGKMTTRTSNENILDKEKTEMKVRLDTAEKQINKLRNEIVEKDEKTSHEKVELLKKFDETRTSLELIVQNLTNQLADVENYKEQFFMLKERIFMIEEAQERDRKVWNEERMLYQFKIEDTKMAIESWLSKIRELNENEQLTQNSVIETLEKDIEKHLFSKDSVAYSNMRRREDSYSLETLFDSYYRGQVATSPNDSPSVPVPITPTYNSSLGKLPYKSVSLDWTNRMTRSQLTPDMSGSNQSINSPSFMRNRSVSPDQSRSLSVTRKITNYPDPTPGFMLKSASRHSSVESVSKDANDYSSKSFTLPGLKNNHSASRISPARQKFFETPPPEVKVSSNVEEKEVESKKIQLTVPPVGTISQKTSQESEISKPLVEKIEIKKTEENVSSQSKTENISKTEIQKLSTDVKNVDSRPIKTGKSKSASIAPSILQLRMKFVQKPGNSPNPDSSVTQKT